MEVRGKRGCGSRQAEDSPGGVMKVGHVPRVMQRGESESPVLMGQHGAQTDLPACGRSGLQREHDLQVDGVGCVRPDKPGGGWAGVLTFVVGVALPLTLKTVVCPASARGEIEFLVSRLPRVTHEGFKAGALPKAIGWASGLGCGQVKFAPFSAETVMQDEAEERVDTLGVA
ncbi:MAG TPA: hypothetical protein DHV85_14170 [Candidatus Accumulibacter sp.]|nr:hypothetical protein [Accumulibacter sp.]